MAEPGARISRSLTPHPTKYGEIRTDHDETLTGRVSSAGLTLKSLLPTCVRRPPKERSPKLLNKDKSANGI